MEYIKAYTSYQNLLCRILVLKYHSIPTLYSRIHTGRIYSKFCIGEGFSGYYNHVWNVASPSCTGLLFSHISLLGVFIASIGITILSSFIFMYNNYMKDDYNKTKKMLEELNIVKK